jgi:hypothetical protein
VRNGHDWTRQTELIREGTQVVDTLREATHGACAFRKAHIELVDRYYPDVLWCLSEKVTPKIGPRRIPVHTQQREL